MSHGLQLFDDDLLQCGQVQGSFLVPARHQISAGAGKWQRRFGDYRTRTKRAPSSSYQVTFVLCCITIN